MSKDILDKLELKNSENLSELKSDTVLSMSKDLDSIKINDDFSNEEALNDEYSINVSNSDNKLVDSIPACKEEEEKLTGKKDEVDISAFPLFPNLSE